MRDTPAMAWIEQQIIGSAARDGVLRPVAERMEQEYKVAVNSFGTGIFLNTRILSLLYLLLVYPREVWMREGRAEEITNLLDWSLDYLPPTAISLGRPSGELDFIRRVRNAVSHAKVDFDGDRVEFWDGRSGTEVFRCQMTFQEVEEFLGAVGKLFSNHRERLLQ